MERWIGRQSINLDDVRIHTSCRGARIPALPLVSCSEGD